MTITLKPGINEDIHIPVEALLGGNDEAFYQFAARYPDLTIERDVDGCIILEPPVGFQTGGFESEALGELFIWNRKHKLGMVFSPSTAFVLRDGSLRCPDAAWISHERIAELPESEWHRFAKISPDFVIEIRSESDRLKHQKEKMEEYMKNGVRLGFLIDPQAGQAYVYRPDAAVVQVSDFSGTLTGDPELPGFELPLGLFVRGK